MAIGRSLSPSNATDPTGPGQRDAGGSVPSTGSLRKSERERRADVAIEEDGRIEAQREEFAPAGGQAGGLVRASGVRRCARCDGGEGRFGEGVAVDADTAPREDGPGR